MINTIWVNFSTARDEKITKFHSQWIGLSVSESVFDGIPITLPKA